MMTGAMTVIAVKKIKPLGTVVTAGMTAITRIAMTPPRIRGGSPGQQRHCQKNYEQVFIDGFHFESPLQILDECVSEKFTGVTKKMERPGSAACRSIDRHGRKRQVCR
jgi:hypothetical protein